VKRAIGALALLAAVVTAWWLVRSADSAAPSGSQVLQAAPRNEAEVELPDVDVARIDASAAAPLDATVPAPLLTTATLTVAPPPNAILAAPANVELTREADGWTDTRSVPDATGARWRELPAGRYRLRALGTAWDVAPDLELAAGEERAVELHPLTLLAGRVLGSRSGQPVASYQLSAWRHATEGPEAGEPALLHSGPVADPEGRFALAGIELPAEPGAQVQVSVYTEARLSLPGPRLDAPPDERWTSLELLVSEPLVIGRVRLEGAPEGKHVKATAELVHEIVQLQHLRVDDDGRPWLVMEQVKPTQIAGFRTDPDGRYAIALPWAPPDPRRLVVVAAGWLPYVSEPLAIPATGPPLELDVTLQQGGRVEGTVNVPAGAPDASHPAAWPTLIVARPAGALVGRAPDQVAASPGYEPHGPEGPAYFALAGLSPGEHDIEVQVMPLDALPGRSLSPRKLRARVTVAAGEATPLVLDYDAAPAGLTLRGQVRLPPEIPAERARIGLFRPEPGEGSSKPLHQSTVAADGRFELAGLEPGSWLLVASGAAKASNVVALAARELTLDERTPEQDLDLTVPALQLVAGAGRAGQRMAITGTSGLSAFDALLAQGALGARVPADGVVRLFGLPPGLYEAALGEARVLFELAPGTATLVVTLP
jgi:hypothetical protein